MPAPFVAPSQYSPVKPAGQEHWPSVGAHTASFEQRHSSEHSRPYLPLGQAGGESSNRSTHVNST